MRICYVLIVNGYGSLLYSKCAFNAASVEQRVIADKASVVLTKDPRTGNAIIRSTLTGEDMLLVSPTGVPVNVDTVVNLGYTVQEYMAQDTVYPVTVYAKQPPLTNNELLILASLFHSLSEVTQKIDGTAAAAAIKHIKFEQFSVFCYPSAAGIKLLAICDLKAKRPMTGVVPCERSHLIKMEGFLSNLYKLYARIIPLDPYQSPDQPIKSERFSQYLSQLLVQFNEHGTS